MDEPDCGGFTVHLLETEGSAAGLTEIEAYAGAHDALPRLLKLADADGNFVYDYRLSGAETEAVFSLYAIGASGDMADYTVTCTGDGCAAEVRNDRLYVSCPRGRSWTTYGRTPRCALRYTAMRLSKRKHGRPLCKALLCSTCAVR